MIDIVIYEDGDGGEMLLQGNDIATTEGFTNQPYLAMFGGNVEASTTGNETENEQRFDWWGNAFTPDEPEKQMNSSTERAMNENALSSSGRAAIENAVKDDLRFLRDLGELSVSVVIDELNKIKINAELQQPEKTQDENLKYLWDGTRNETYEDIIL